MRGSVLLYAGLGLFVAAAAALFLRGPAPVRLARSGALAAPGALLAFAALVLPVGTARRSTRAMARIDALLPEFQFEEFHERFVNATPEAVDAAIRSVTAREIKLFRLFTFLRNPARAWDGQRESILNPPPEKPILDVALGSGFALLADDRGREIVLGTLVVRPRGTGVAVSDDREEAARRFAALAAPGYAKAAMDFRIEPSETGCRLTTETRVYATDPATARAFARYWRAIRPGSALLRRTWLDAIAARAEGPPR